jgi:predicted regulator of Ras-like GTPase activity (Roadblock/LC7/MglB family)
MTPAVVEAIGAPLMWVWALSAAGAVLFFCAGMLVARARATSSVIIAVGDGREARLDDEGDLPTEAMTSGVEVPTAALPTEMLDRVLFAEADTRATRMELEEQVKLRRRSEQVRERLAGELTAERQGRAEVARTAGLLRDRIDELERRLARSGESRESGESPVASPGPPDKLIADLRHDLAVATEQARARTAETARARDEYAAAAAAAGELDALRAESQSLREVNGELLARLLRQGAGGSVPHGPTSLATPALDQPLPASPGDALQALVEDLTRRPEVQAAVVADELGLVVAASGERGDELAAAGVMIAHAGTRAEKLLTAAKVRRISVEDDRDLTITVCPLVAAEGDLALVTLAHTWTKTQAAAAVETENQT